LIELNVANTRGIDTIRELIEISAQKSLDGRPKCFLLDEVHMLTKEAQNALLKILEDVPSEAFFLLCTTEPNRVINTILTRCSRYRLNKLRDSEIRSLIDRVCKLEKIQLEEDIVDIIVYSADGVPRTALVLLEQLKDVEDLELAEQLALDCIYDEEQEIIDLCRGLVQEKFSSWKEVMACYRNIKNTDIETIRKVMFQYFTTCLKGAGGNMEVSEKFYDWCKSLDFFSNNEEGKLICAIYEIFYN
jgi:DNA polymerase III gamma/tau subunit